MTGCYCTLLRSKSLHYLLCDQKGHHNADHLQAKLGFDIRVFHFLAAVVQRCYTDKHNQQSKLISQYKVFHLMLVK